MTPGARLAAAIEVLSDIGARRRPAADTLKDWGLSHRFAGSKDRSAIGNIVYDALRWRLSGAWIMGSDSPRALVLATVAYRWGIGADGLAGMVSRRAIRVGSSKRPVSGMPRNRWKRSTAPAVSGPQIPSIGPLYWLVHMSLATGGDHGNKIDRP